jgi:hypothetical protein
MSATPRTDAEEAKNAEDVYKGGWVPADFARELERENTKRQQILMGCKDHDNAFEKRIEELANDNAKLRVRLDWWIANAEGIAKDRAQLRETLSDLNRRVHSGYDFNADPDGMTLRVGEALARVCPDKAVEFPDCGSKAWIDREVERSIEKGD